MRLLLKFTFIFAVLTTCHAQVVLQDAVLQDAVLGGGAAAGGSLAWGGELGRTLQTSSAGTTAITSGSTVAAGGMIVAVALGQHATQYASSCADSSGNTYTMSVYTNDGSYHMTMFTAPVTTQLDTADTITITWANAAFTYRVTWAGYVTGATAVDVTATNVAYSQAISIPRTTTAATVIVGCLSAQGSTSGYSGGNFTQVGAVATQVSMNGLFNQLAASAGAQNMGGTLTGNDNWLGGWVAIK